MYSATLNKWLLFPRRVSTEAYEEVRRGAKEAHTQANGLAIITLRGVAWFVQIADETRGSNMLLIADETFTEVEERRITTLVPERGFSSVVELLRGGHAPTTHVVALRSAEDSRKNTQTSCTSKHIRARVLTPSLGCQLLTTMSSATLFSVLSVLSLENAEGALMQEVEVPGGHKYGFAGAAGAVVCCACLLAHFCWGVGNRFEGIEILKVTYE